jgi:transposase
VTELPANLRPTTLEEALGVIEQLLRIIAEQQGQIVRLQARVTELERRLEQNSQNSSRPPSSDSPTVPPPAQRPRSKRRPGGQPGHEGHQRMLLPEDQVDRIVPVKPRRCRRCAAPLQGVDPTPGRHQVTEVPLPQPHVTEYQLHTLACARCGATTTAALPAGVPRGAFGPRLEATVAVCTGVYHLSRRLTVGLLGDLFGVDLALGTVSACEQAVSAAVAAPVAEAHRYVQGQEVVHVDETGWREGAHRAWLWVMVSTLVTVFLIHARRNTAAARVLMGECQAILVSDRWSAYKHWPIEQRQLCWAHLVREFTAFTERGGAAARLGRALLRDADTMFARWHKVRAGTLSRPRFWQEMRPLRQRVERRLRRGVTCPDAQTAATCRDLVPVATALWTFIDVPGVEPTNNAAERALRPAVLWRKGSFGTHSAAGSRFAERMLTVATTLKQQGRNVVDYLADACAASVHGHRPPSLLPDATRMPARRLATV